MNYICYAVAFVACIIGNICGMGGGVIIKPVLDSLGSLPVTTISFLSSCTVLGMSFWSVGKSVVRHDSKIDFHLTTFLGIGAAVGGIIGKKVFQIITSTMTNTSMVSLIQAGILMVLTLATLVYVKNEDHIQTLKISNPLICLLVGFTLGIVGAFLGIGGGPFNVVALCFFFSLTTKAAAQNSLYIIFISQTAGLLQTIISNNVPSVELTHLLGMILFGILGSTTGSIINSKISEKGVKKLFAGAMILVIAICIYNMYRAAIIL